MRSDALLVVAAAALVAAAGASARSPKEPTLRPRAADVRVAHGLLVTRSDVPAGFVDKGVDRSGDGTFRCKGLQQPDLHRLVETADVDGHTFEGAGATGFTQIQSSASLFRSRREAATAVDAFRRVPTSTMRRCFAVAFRSGLPKGARVGPFRVTPIRRTTGDLRLLVWEIRTKLYAVARWVPVDMVLAFYERDRAVSLLMLTNAGGGIDSATARDLSAGMAARLEAAPL